MLIQARFSPQMQEAAFKWIKLSPRYIVCQEQATRAHFHAVFESSVGDEAIRKRFQTECRAQGLVSKKGGENAHYGGVKLCDAGAYEYASKSGKFIISQGFTEEELESFRVKGDLKYNKLATDLVVAVSTVAGETVLIPKPKSDSMRARFVRYMIRDRGWVANKTLHHEYYDEKYKELIDALTEFWENAFTTPQGVVCIEHAKWIFGTDDVRDAIKQKNCEAIKRMLR